MRPAKPSLTFQGLSAQIEIDSPNVLAVSNSNIAPLAAPQQQPSERGWKFRIQQTTRICFGGSQPSGAGRLKKSVDPF